VTDYTLFYSQYAPQLCNKPRKGLDFNLRGSPIDIRESPSFFVGEAAQSKRLFN